MKFTNFIPVNEVRKALGVMLTNMNCLFSKEGFLLFRKLITFPVGTHVLGIIKVRLENKLGEGGRNQNLRKLLNVINELD